MKHVYTIPFTQPFMARFVEYIHHEFVEQGVPLNKIAIVFGGKRPALFLKRELAKRYNRSFIPPSCFTIDDLIKTIIYQHESFQPAVDLDHCFVLYQIAQKVVPGLLVGRDSFAAFLPWAQEILRFMDQLDLEQISEDQLLNIKASASIGYAVPDSINELLMMINELRKEYHRYMLKLGVYNRGFQYHRAAALMDEMAFFQYDAVIFANFFYFHHTEATIVQHLLDQGKARLVFQGDQRRWPVLAKTANRMRISIHEAKDVVPTDFNLHLYSGSDAHTQVGLARMILEKIDRQDRAVIVLPNPDLIMPLLSEISPLLTDFNISMGYPLKRSSLYSLIDLIFRAQRTLKEGLFYTRDYLRVLQHPFVRGFQCSDTKGVTETIVYILKQTLTGETLSDISGMLFIDLATLENDEALLSLIHDRLQQQHIDITDEDIKETLAKIHHHFFGMWIPMRHFADFIHILDQFLHVMTAQTSLQTYPLNIKIANRLWSMIQELKSASFLKEPFDKEELFRMMASRMENEIVAFVGSPLKGLQILGLFETRSLDFDHVIMLDVNDGVLPHLTLNDPLIPRDVMISLGLNRVELEEEIQRYQFMRLISSAKTVHLIYRDAKGQERSRFIEELVWEQETRQQHINIVPVKRGIFSAVVRRYEACVDKTPAMIDFLKSMTFSASSVNTYLRDPLVFYRQYVLGLREREDLLDEPENRHIGNFVHDILEDMFKPMLGQRPAINAAFIKRFMMEVERRFINVFGKGRGSDAYLMKSVLLSRLRRFLDVEKVRVEQSVQQIQFIEKRFTETVSLPCADINFVYRVDRVDQLNNGTILILDYKTGGVDPMPRKAHDIEGIDFDRETLLEQIRSFQMPLYLHYLHRQYPDKPINAAFYNLRTLDLKYFITAKDQPQRDFIISVYLRALNAVFEEMFDLNVPWQSSS